MEYVGRERKILSYSPEYPAHQVPPAEEEFRDTLYWRDGYPFSRATDDCHVFETLYRLPWGRWIVRQLVRNHGHRSYCWFEVSGEEAHAWLERCGYTGAGQVATRRCVFCGGTDGLEVPDVENVCVSCIRLGAFWGLWDPRKALLEP